METPRIDRGSADLCRLSNIPTKIGLLRSDLIPK